MPLTPGNFYSGAGVPNNADGVDGDHYRNTSNQDLWFKSGWTWDVVGNLRDDAPDGIGTTIQQGAGVPLNANGEDGFYYRDTTNQNLWFKQSGLWALVANLGVGAVPIAPGTPFLEDAGVPDNGDGVEGQYYRNTTNQDIYRKGSGVWARIGTWADAVDTGTTFLTGPGAPSTPTGSNGQYYRDTNTEDIYYKSSGTWAQVGNWLGVQDGTVTISTWDMTGAQTQLAPVLATGATFGGTDPAFTLTPAVGSLPGGGTYYIAGVETQDGIPLTGSGTQWAELIKPTVVGGNLHSYGFAIINSGATLTDLIAVLNGNTPTHDVWGGFVSNRVSTPGFVSVQTIANNVVTAGADVNLSLVDGDSLYVGLNLATKELQAQRNTGSISTLPAISTTGMPTSNTLKAAVVLLFTSATPSFSAGSLTFDPATSDSGKTPFQVTGEALLPVGAADNTVYEVVTSSGSYGGVFAQVGDFVWLYDNTTKIFKIEQDLHMRMDPRKRYKVIAGSIRQTALGLGWEFIDTTQNRAVNVSSVSVDGLGRINIQYGFTAPAKVYFTAWGDETLSNLGLKVGVSAGNNEALLELSAPLGGAIVNDGGSPAIRGITGLGADITSQTLTPSAGTLTVVHASVSHPYSYGTPVQITNMLNNGAWTVSQTKTGFTATYRRRCVGQIDWNGGSPTMTTAIAYPADIAVTGTQNSSGKIRLNVASHNLAAGMVVTVASVGGTTEANGQWYIDSVGTGYIVLGNGVVSGTPSVFTNAWTSGGTITMEKVIWKTNHFEVFHPYAGEGHFTQVQQNYLTTPYHLSTEPSGNGEVGFHVYVHDTAGALVTSPAAGFKFSYDRDVNLPAVIPSGAVASIWRDNIPVDADLLYSSNGSISFFGLVEVDS